MRKGDSELNLSRMPAPSLITSACLGLVDADVDSRALST
jgi:hypothetical protein